MIKTSTLTGARLDYWTARAEGVPAENLEIRPVQRSDKHHCVRKWNSGDPIIGPDLVAVQYSSHPAWWAPLIEKHGIAPVSFTEDGARVWGAFIRGDGGHYIDTYLDYADGQGTTPQEAICRAVVRAAFGDEVEDVPCQ